MIEMGKITITLTAQEDGDMVIDYESTGDMPLAMQIGVLEMTKDTILNGPEDE